MTTRTLATLALCVLLSACPSEPRRPDATAARAEALLDAASRQPAPPPAPAPPAAVEEALLGSIGLPTPAGWEEPRFDIAVHEAPARAFFASLVADTPYNMVVHPEVSGTISALDLKNVTVPEVLETVRTVYGYDYQRTPSGFVVLPAGLKTRIFQVDYLNFKRGGESRTRVSSGQVTETPEARLSDTGGGATIITGGQQAGALSGSTIRTESETAFWEELQAALAALVGEQGQVIVSPQSGVVVVRAHSAAMGQVSELMARIQANVQRQVILEAKILEVELSDAYRAGINWAGFFDTDRAGGIIGQTGVGQLPGETNTQRLIDVLDAEDFAFAPFDPDSGLASAPFGGIFSAAVRIEDFAAFIELLETQGSVQVLSTTTTTGTATTTIPDVTLTPFFSGIALDVTPQIDAAGEVILHIHPSVSEVTDQEKTLIIGNVAQTLPLARSTVRESDSVIRARSGQLVIIGGLMQDSTRDLRAATPGLADIPVLGHAFRDSDESSGKSELVILLRPTVVHDASVWSEALGDMRDRVRGIREGIVRRRPEPAAGTKP
jgi:MSHA biogenesis protein MshL